MTKPHFEFDGHSLITPASIAEVLKGNIATPEEDALAAASTRLSDLLDSAQKRFEKGDAPRSIIHDITLGLHEIRATEEPSVWRRLVLQTQTHPVAAYFLQDPLTKWSWDKPRGYSGDAHLLDLIYRHPDTAHQVEAATKIGRELFEYTSTAPSSMANCDRRDILARFVDEAAARHGPATEVLSVAAGHLREAEYSLALRNKAIKRWAALDQDPVSIAKIAKSYGGSIVESVNGSVRDILTAKAKPGTFEHVYISGLYDYLTDKVAIKLTRRALEFVKPGGTFLFANYSYPIIVDGYLETFMNWVLLLRSEEDLKRIIEASTQGMDVDTEVFFGFNRNIAYGVIRKR
ncbi:class I SAM-dependent methyltransferase [Rhizobium laguerreae]|uniref:class I SAM-dependent methyltransferase n=1 Tax=Rhizobium laguerreae TaxID=1076926 RepID=UPI001C90D5AF|nr:class I SAM-dependent methyltransferase [Rhizobium laguerreae]MBY3155488.1 class I SAM-dependent methyltransferase [Rhizobium laguerreae]